MSAPAHNAHRRRRHPEGAENYAKAIYELQAKQGAPVGTGAVAQRVGVTPASASAMLKRLADDGLVEHAPYRGVRLTGDGEQLALEMLRHHRLIELFLAEVLGMPWDRVHEEAEVLEHHISEELEELIAAKLGQPARDPHGDPIPSRDLDLAEDESVPLAEIEPGQTTTFVRVSDSDAAMLRYLGERGIQPGVEVHVRSREPFNGPVSVEVEGKTHSLGGDLIERMRVAGESLMASRAEIEVSSYLEEEPDRVWERVVTPEGINHELMPLMRMTVPEGLENGIDERIQVGSPIGRSWVLLFGVVPFDYDDLTLAELDPGRGFLERSKMLSQRAWEHERRLVASDGGCVITDRVAWEPRLPIPARWLRPMFRAVFRHRHARLRKRFGGRAAE